MSSLEEIHIITHQVPWPVDFGGVFDLFYKIKALSESGVKIHLHCFTKKEENAPILNRYCSSVTHYKRTSFFQSFKFNLPFIIRSRSSTDLISNLKKDNFPIIFDGIHTTFPLFFPLGKDRKIKIRLHNVEYLYYEKLAELESGFYKKMYFKLESYLLKRYESKLAKAYDFWALSTQDLEVYRSNLGCEKIEFLPAFLPWNNPTSHLGLGNYCLYHGNLSVNENIKAVEWLLDEVFSKNKIPFVIAGKNPSEELKKKVYQFQHTCIVENISEFEMDDLIAKAQINVLPSFNQTGIKLKVLHAMFKGRHCIVNKEAIEGAEIEEGYLLYDGSADLTDLVNQFFNIPFTESDYSSRSRGLELYDNKNLIDKITAWLC